MDSTIAFLMLAVATAWPRRRGRTAVGRSRVLHVVPADASAAAVGRVAEVVNRTPADRYDVDLLVLGSRIPALLQASVLRSGVRILPPSTSDPRWRQAFAVRRQCTAGRYDVVHTWGSIVSVAGVAGARLAGVSRVLAVVSPTTESAPWPARLADMLCARAADVVAVDSESRRSMQARRSSVAGDRIAVVRNGLEPSRFLVDATSVRRQLRQALDVANDRPLIGTVAVESPHDRAVFLDVVRDLVALRPDVSAIVVADEVLRATVAAEIVANGLSRAVSCVAADADGQLLLAFDVLVLASAQHSDVLLQAAFLGVPAVAARNGINQDVLPEPTDTFEAGDWQSAARRVARLLDEPSLAELRAQDTRCRALTLFTADRMASLWCALYDPCAEGCSL